MSDFKQLYAYDDLSQAAEVSSIVSSIISRGRWHCPVIPSEFKTPLRALRASKCVPTRMWDVMQGLRG